MPDADTRCLSVRQPWAAAIIYGGKTIENRTWSTSYRGRLWIHAAKKTDASDRAMTTLERLGKVPVESGAIIGHVRLVGMTDELEPADEWWAVPGMTWWRLADAKPLRRPIPCLGAPGLWRPPW